MYIMPLKAARIRSQQPLLGAPGYRGPRVAMVVPSGVTEAGMELGLGTRALARTSSAK